MEFDLTSWEWIIAIAGAFLIGAAKAGLKGIGAIIMTMMALVFGAKPSTGIVLPLLAAGDVLAVYYYRREADWRLLRRLLPFMFAGVLAGVWVGKDLDEETFKFGMAIIIILGVIMMFYIDRRKSKYIPDNLAFAGIMGLGAGFTTMIGNLAGAFSNMFFLAMRLPKNAFIGTAAWLYFITNLFKMPFHVLVWGTITGATLRLNFLMLPALFLGFYLGVKGIGLIQNEHYRKLILIMTALGAILILWK